MTDSPTVFTQEREPLEFPDLVAFKLASLKIFFDSIGISSPSNYLDIDYSSLTVESLRVITLSSLEQGLIPSVCPVCRNSLALTSIRGNLVVHHWGSDSQTISIRLGKYRRLCWSCNACLGRVFKGVYPDTWEEQLKGLSEYFSNFKSTYINFNGSIGYWSLITKGELFNYRVDKSVSSFLESLSENKII